MSIANCRLIFNWLFIVLLISNARVGVSQDYSLVRDVLAQKLPHLAAAEIRPSAIDGLLELRAETSIAYITDDGDFLLAGPLYALETTHNLSEARLAEYRLELLKDIPTVKPVVYAAEDDRYRVTVITDIDCPYCRQLHQEMQRYNAAGITVDYLLLPRAGKASASYEKAVNALCAAQPDMAITAAMNGDTSEAAACAHPVDQHMQLARQLGAESTPNIVLPDGKLIRGYKTPDELIRLLDSASYN